MRANPLKAKVLAGGRSFGLFAWEFLTPGLPQIAREAGAEFLLLDMEHSGAGIDTIKQQLAYCRGVDIAPWVRVPTNQYHFVARVLDMGAIGVMVPMVETAEQAREIVSWTRYPPLGRRGAALGAAHDDYSGGSVKEKFAALNERCFLMLQIETEIGVAHVEDIAAVPGVDSIWIGFLDLSNFLGVPGETQHPTYLAALDKIVAAAKKHNRPLGTAAANEAQAREALARGFSMVSFGTDVYLLQAALSQRIQAVRGGS
jgi:2-dehydro-3-deoxyglucarate aldolase/4-hydroxy-2-oxoheptanedioate aldolase